MLVLALLLCCAGAQAEAEGRNAYFSDGTTAYQLADGGLWKLDEALQPAEKVCDTEAEAGFADAQGIILAVPTEAGYRFERQGGEALFEVETNRRLREFVMSADGLVALWRYSPEEWPAYSDGSDGPLTAYQLNGAELYAPCYSAGAVALDAEGGVLVAKYEPNAKPVIQRWDMATGLVRDGMELEGVTALCAVQGETVYVYRDGIYAAGETGGTRLLGEVPYAELGLFAVGSQVTAYCREGEADLCTFPVERQAADASVLTLVNCSDFNDDRMKAAIAIWQEAHPEGSVQFVGMDDDQLNTALMANEPGLDILFMNNFSAANYVNAGVVEDLNDSPEVMAGLDGWIDLEGVSTWNGVRFGVPLELSLDVIKFNESLAGLLPEGLDPKQMTWKQLLEVGAQFDGDTNGDGRQDAWLLQGSRRFPAFLYQYIRSGDDLSELSFDTELFRELMTLYRQCVQNGAYANYGDCESSAAVFSMSMAGTVDSSECLSLPRLEGAPSVTCFVMAMGVNRGSANRELALEFLADYCSVEAQRQIYTGTADDRYFGWLRELSAYEGYDQMSDSAKAAAASNQALFEQAKMSWYSVDFSAYCGDQIEAYIDGQIELDELIRNLQQRKQMVLMG